MALLTYLGNINDLFLGCVGGANWDEHKHQKVDIPHEEQQKNWWDLDDKRKKELEVRRVADHDWLH